VSFLDLHLSYFLRMVILSSVMFKKVFLFSQVFSVSKQPFLDCPSTSDGNVTALTSSLQFTFRITLATVTQTQAWSACRDAGERLMKIETVEKQTVVQYIVSTCQGLYNRQVYMYCEHVSYMCSV